MRRASADSGGPRAWVSGLLENLGTDGRTGVQELCRRFWKPVYWFVRRGWAVYVVDRPQHGRSPFNPAVQGEMGGLGPTVALDIAGRQGQIH